MYDSDTVIEGDKDGLSVPLPVALHVRDVDDVSVKAPDPLDTKLALFGCVRETEGVGHAVSEADGDHVGNVDPVPDTV